MSRFVIGGRAAICKARWLCRLVAIQAPDRLPPDPSDGATMSRASAATAIARARDRPLFSFSGVGMSPGMGDGQGSLTPPFSSMVQRGLCASSQGFRRVDDDGAVATPERLRRLPTDPCAGRPRLVGNRVHLLRGREVDGERHATPSTGILDMAVLGQRRAAPQRHDHVARLEEYDIVVRFGVRLPSEGFIEAARPVEVGDSQRDHVDPLLHDAPRYSSSTVVFCASSYTLYRAAVPRTAVPRSRSGSRTPASLPGHRGSRDRGRTRSASRQSP